MNSVVRWREYGECHLISLEELEACEAVYLEYSEASFLLNIFLPFFHLFYDKVFLKNLINHQSY